MGLLPFMKYVNLKITLVTLCYPLGSTSTQPPCPKVNLSGPVQRVKRRPRPRPIATQPSRLPSMPSCIHCHAKRFPYEPNGFCCYQGDIKLYDVAASDELVQLYTSNSPESKDFRKHIRAYNNAFSFTSFSVILDTRYTSNHTGIYTFRAQGQVYHFINSLHPKNEPPAYLQLYFYNTNREVSNRLDYALNLLRPIIERLIDVLQPNPCSTFF